MAQQLSIWLLAVLLAAGFTLPRAGMPDAAPSPGGAPTSAMHMESGCCDADAGDACGCCCCDGAAPEAPAPCNDKGQPCDGCPGSCDCPASCCSGKAPPTAVRMMTDAIIDAPIERKASPCTKHFCARDEHAELLRPPRA